MFGFRAVFHSGIISNSLFFNHPFKEIGLVDIGHLFSFFFVMKIWRE